jgi:subtilisin family serine protease
VKSIKKTAITVGLAATLAVSPFLSMVSSAAEPGLSDREYSQFEERLQGQKVQTSQLSKEKNDPFSKNQLIIKYGSPLSTSEHRKAGGKLVKRFATLGYDVIQIQGNQKLENVAKNYAQLSNVTSITRSAYGKTFTATDPKVSQMYHLSRLNLSKAQSMAGKNKVKVGVIDTGLDANHPELKNKLVANVNVMDPLKKGKADTHGTHVAGIIAAEKNNGIGGFGMAPNSQMVSIDVSNRSFFVTDYVVAEGVLEAIRQNVKVINMSLGFYYPSPILEDAVKKAIEKGIIVVAAAGNDGAAVLNYPASFEGVISVGATNEKNQLAYFSTYGPSVDVVAPGQNVYSSVFDVDKGSSFVKMSGTSMASPVVAGAVSLLLSKYPKLTPYQVNYMLTKTAKDLGESGYDLKYGYGLIDPVKLLSFNPSKIPADPTIKEKDILSKAKQLGSFTTKNVWGKIQKLNQTDFYSMTVKKDEYIQATLTGMDKYDMKFEWLFFGGEKVEPVEINDVSVGKVEGGFFQAPADGTLVVAVKDSFGKYDFNGLYAYNLGLERRTDFVDEENSVEKPVEIASLPYESEKFYFNDELSASEELPSDEESVVDEQPVGQDGAGNDGESLPADEGEPVVDETEPPIDEGETNDEEDAKEDEEFRGIPGDSDFFRFRVSGNPDDGMQVIKVKIPDVAGIDSSLVLHRVERMDGEVFTSEMDRVSNNGYGKGEELAFNAVAGEEYVLEVTNKQYVDEFMLRYGDFEIDYERSYSSLQPYQISIESKVLDKDEDGIPFGDEGENSEELLQEDGLKQFLSKKSALRETIVIELGQEMAEAVEMIKDSAISISENDQTEGYIQTVGDEDWYTFTPKNNSTFEVNIGDNYPVGMAVMTYDDEMEDFSMLYSNENWTSLDEISYKTSFAVGLQAGTTYYLRVTDPMYRPSFEPYHFSIKTKIKNTADANESNDSFKKATKVTTKAVRGNFASVNDIDTYYFKPGKDGIYGIKVTPQALPTVYKNAPAQLKSEIDPIIVISEDTNGNGKLDKEEESNLILVDYTLDSEEERTGFKTKKAAGYFIQTADYYGVNSSLVPYVLKIDDTKMVDEDKGSVVKNNVPSKPISLGKSLKASGYLNLTSKGDSDYYKLSLSKNKKVKVTLDVPTDIDGKVTIYNSKGKQVAVIDTYGTGDSEIRELTLTKSTYYIKIQDTFNNASTDKYTLWIK